MRQTPAGAERERLTGILLDAHDSDAVEMELMERIGGDRCIEIRREMRSNGGGNPTIRDYCAELNNADLTSAVEALGLD